MEVQIVVGGALLTRDLQESGVSSVHLHAVGTATPRLTIKWSRAWKAKQPDRKVDLAESLNVFSWLDEVIK